MTENRRAYTTRLGIHKYGVRADWTKRESKVEELQIGDDEDTWWNADPQRDIVKKCCHSTLIPPEEAALRSLINDTIRPYYNGRFNYINNLGEGYRLRQGEPNEAKIEAAIESAIANAAWEDEVVNKPITLKIDEYMVRADAELIENVYGKYSNKYSVDDKHKKFIEVIEMLRSFGWKPPRLVRALLFGGYSYCKIAVYAYAISNNHEFYMANSRELIKWVHEQRMIPDG